MVYVVFKFDKIIKDWVEIKSFGHKKCAQNYVGFVSRDTDDMYCIEERACARGDYARTI